MKAFDCNIESNVFVKYSKNEKNETIIINKPIVCYMYIGLKQKSLTDKKMAMLLYNNICRFKMLNKTLDKFIASYSIEKKTNFYYYNEPSYYIRINMDTAQKYYKVLERIKESSTLQIFDNVGLLYQNIINYNFKIDPKINFSTMCFDIEVYSFDGNFPDAKIRENEIFQIGVVIDTYENKTDKYIFTLGNYELNGIIVYSFDSEEKLIFGFLDFVFSKKKPDIFFGYNSNNFDLKYIKSRANRYGLKFKFVYNKYTDSYNHPGMIVGDLYKIILKEHRLESYTLENVSIHFLKESKNDFSYSNVFSAYKNYKENNDVHLMKECAEYCVKDAHLVLQLLKKLNIINFLISSSNIVGTSFSNFINLGAQNKVISQIYKFVNPKNYIIPIKSYDQSNSSDDSGYVGALVFKPEPGIYKNVIPFDFCSLYPSIMIQNNLCFSTCIENVDVDDTGKLEVAINDNEKYYFKKRSIRQGVLPELLQTLLLERNRVKDEIKIASDDEISKLLDSRQLALKISANSIYGFCGMSRGKLTMKAVAAATTSIGRGNLIKAKEILTQKFNMELVYGDTDSNYVQFKDGKFDGYNELWARCLDLEKSLLEYFEAPMKLAFEEAIYKNFLILTKKRYICEKIIDATGMQDSKYFLRGVLLKRRDFPNVTKNLYKKIVDLIFLEKTHVVIDNIFEMYMRMLTCQIPINDYIFSKSVRDVLLYKNKPLPVEVKERKKKLENLFIFTKCQCSECDENCYKNCNACLQFKLKSLPNHVNLAYKINHIRKEGQINSGDRINFVYVNKQISNNHLQIESTERFLKYKEILNIDYFHYMNFGFKQNFELVELVGLGDAYTKMFTNFKNKNLQIKELESFFLNH